MVMGIFFVKYGHIQSHFYRKNCEFFKKKFFRLFAFQKGLAPSSLGVDILG